MTRTEQRNRKGRESMSKKLGKRVVGAIKARANCRCEWCGREDRLELAAGRRMQLDHFVPRAHGGRDTIDNILYSCAVCNRARSDSDAREWAGILRQTRGIHVSVTLLEASLLATEV